MRATGNLGKRGRSRTVSVPEVFLRPCAVAPTRNTSPADSFMTVLTVKIEHTKELQDIGHLTEGATHQIPDLGQVTIIRSNHYVRAGNELLDIFK